MTISEAMLNSIGLLVIGSLLSLAIALYMFRRSAVLQEAQVIAADHQRTLARVAELEVKLAMVNQSVVPLNMAMQAMLIKELTHYHTPEMDSLMQKLGPPNILTDPEETRLSILLEERTRDMGPTISPSERDAALILPAIVKRAKAEAETLAGAEAIKLRMITIAAVVGIPVIPGESPDKE